MGNVIQRLIYNYSVIAPILVVFALVWWLQKGQLVFPLVISVIGIVLIILCIKSFNYAKKNLAPIRIRTSGISPCDGWIIAYIISYLLPFSSLVLSDINLIVSAGISVLILIVLPRLNTASPNPILFIKGYHFYKISGEHGISDIVLISKRKIRKAKDIKTVTRLFDFLFLDSEAK